MASYASAAQTDNVKAICNALQTDFGLDVWRDEVGSSVLPPMIGHVNSSMAEAVDFSDFVVVFVSRVYQSTVSCQLEARYANTKAKEGKCKLVFVMMEQDFTTDLKCSDPVSGWLGMMVGDNVWYPGWDAAHTHATASSIARLITSEREFSSHLLSACPTTLPGNAPDHAHLKAKTDNTTADAAIAAIASAAADTHAVSVAASHASAFHNLASSYMQGPSPPACKAQMDQYFLTSVTKIGIIVKAAAISRSDAVLEVGAGIGSVAKHYPLCQSLCLVDLDPDLVKILRCQTANPHARRHFATRSFHTVRNSCTTFKANITLKLWRTMR